MVENLLYVTRLNDGRLKLELTDQLVDEVVNEAVSHLKKKSIGHKVTVKCRKTGRVRHDPCRR